MTPEELIAARQKLGLTQSALAAKIGRTERQVRRWETNEAPIPKWVALLLRKVK